MGKQYVVVVEYADGTTRRMPAQADKRRAQERCERLFSQGWPQVRLTTVEEV